MNNKLYLTPNAYRHLPNFSKLWGLIRWSLIRQKYLIPTFSIVQALFAIAIVCGLALMIPQLDNETIVYLSSGAITLGIIAVGCVLAPQIVSESKYNGLFEYQRTLPVPRNNILIADIIIWGVASLPGVIMGCVTAILRFNIDIHVTPFSVAIIIISQITTICIGFAMAYWLPPNVMALGTQIIMIGGMLFSPITYPADRLPECLVYFYQILPFVPMSNLIRCALFQTVPFSILDLIVVLMWAVLAFSLALTALARRK